MSEKTGIEWTDATWNPIRGCSRVSEGCRNCYAETVANRFKGPGQPYEGLIARGGQWNGNIRVVDSLMDQPLRWKNSRRIFVNSMSDLFHESVPDEAIARVFQVMYFAERHTFQVLTKRPQRMLEFLRRCGNGGGHGWITHNGEPVESYGGTGIVVGVEKRWPLPNVWLGVSVEDQSTADERIRLLLQTPAAVRWISAEPLLGPVDLYRGGWSFLGALRPPKGNTGGWEKGLDWVVVGGESGPGARPMHSEWARSLRDQCQAFGVPFFFKQWGEFSDQTELSVKGGSEDRIFTADGTFLGAGVRKYGGMVDTEWREKGGTWMSRVGKKQAGRLLDGREWNEYPETP